MLRPRIIIREGNDKRTNDLFLGTVPRATNIRMPEVKKLTGQILVKLLGLNYNAKLPVLLNVDSRSVIEF